MQLLYRGAEANIYLGEYLGRKCIIKERVSKRYRIPELDQELREYRTRREARILYRLLLAGLHVPAVYHIDINNYTLYIEYIEGEKVADFLDKEPTKAKDIGKEIGRVLAKVHFLHIVHNDFTTANMVLAGGKLYVLDWGMAADSTRLEDKAYDILVFKKAARSRHWQVFEDLWQGFLEGYSEYSQAKEVLEVAEKLEKMGRYFER